MDFCKIKLNSILIQRASITKNQNLLEERIKTIKSFDRSSKPTFIIFQRGFQLIFFNTRLKECLIKFVEPFIEFIREIELNPFIRIFNRKDTSILVTT